MMAEHKKITARIGHYILYVLSSIKNVITGSKVSNLIGL